MEYVERLEKLVHTGKLSEALDFIEALSQEERQQWQIQNLTGVVCSYCGQFNEAATFFEAALKQQPEEAVIQYNLADTYASLNMNRKAKEMLERCRKCTENQDLLCDINALEQRLTEQKGGQVLMAAYFFPPLAGSGVFRSLRFAKYLPLYGWQPTVISTDRPPKGWDFADQSIVAEIPEDMEVVRIPDGISTGRETSLNSDRVQAILSFLRSVLRHSPEADRIYSQVSRSREGITQLLTFPCGALSWAYDTVQYIEKNMDLSQFEVVYTTSGPASAHLIGFYLKQKYGIPWVADYRDPWTFNAYGAAYDPSNTSQRLLFELESVLLHQADCNLTVEASLTQEYVRNFRLPAEKMVSITNGYDEENFSGLNIPTQTDRFTINYSGLLYSGHRSIEPVLQAIQQLHEEKAIELSDIKFRVVGNVVPENTVVAQRFGLSDILVQMGYLSHREALQSNLDSNLLLLLIGEGDKLKSFYSAKLFEYLRSGRPILAIAPKNGVVDQVLRESGHGKVFSSRQIAEIKAMILDEYLKWKNHQGRGLLHSPTIERFEGKRLTQRLTNTLENCKNATLSQALEMHSSLYDDSYKTGGPGGTYRKNYTQSFYYPSWKHAMSYLSAMNRNISILEIACGPGQFANMLFDYGFLDYTGFDYAAEGIALAKKNNPSHKECFFVADAFQTELLQNKYDLVICFEALEHIQKDLELLQRILPGTKLLLSVPNFDDPYHVRYFRSEKDVQERYGKIVHITNISKSMLSEVNCLYYIWGDKL